jgi:hypothetical protein
MARLPRKQLALTHEFQHVPMACSKADLQQHNDEATNIIACGVPNRRPFGRFDV